jgi:hypothetical protein
VEIRLFLTPFRALVWTLALVGWSLAAQDSNVSSTTSVDVNGNRIPDGPTISQTKSASGSQTSVTTQSINGRTVTMEQVEVRVLRDDSSGKLTERIVRRFDPQGNPLPPTRQTIEEQKRPDGGSTTQTTTYTTDINGNTQISERSVVNTQKSAAGQTSETLVDRPTVNGLETVEKASTVVSKQPDGYTSENTTYRRDGNGGFFTAIRQTTEHKVQGAESNDSSAEYERGANGDLQLHEQTVTKTVTRPDGLKDSVVEIYGRNVPGTVTASDAPLRLQEQQTIESTTGPGNSVVQTVNVRRPTISDPNTLGPSRQLSQTVCKGDCKPPKESDNK